MLVYESALGTEQESGSRDSEIAKALIFHRAASPEHSGGEKRKEKRNKKEEIRKIKFELREFRVRT